LLAGEPVTFEQLRETTYARSTGIEVGTAPYAEGGFPTPDGRARLLDPALTSQGVDPLIGYTPPEHAGTGLVLIAPAARFFMNSTFASAPWHNGRMGPPRIHLHPCDAAARGLADGDAVRVHNDRGSFQAAVAVDATTRPGVAFTYKAYWARLSPDRANVNAVTAVRDTDLGGGPTFHDTRVEVSPIGPAAMVDRVEAEEFVSPRS
jgi:anaerobic selenocysteine-containing dehydrogenase